MGLGMYALRLADAGLRQAGLVPDPPRPADTLADVPVVKAFVVRYPSAGAASIQRFYDEFERNQRYFTSWQARAKEGDLEAMERIQQAGGPRLFVQLTGIKEAMSNQAKAIRDISKNPMFTSIEKRQYIDTLYYGLLQTAQGGLQTMRRFDEAAQQQQQRLRQQMQPSATGMTPLEQLRAAGFSEQEIGQWAGEQRSTLQQAGFADAEIDHYLAGPKGR